MQFSTLYARVESLATLGSGYRSLVKDAIQMGLYRATAKDLPYLMTDSFITTTAPYTAGTVTVSSGSTTLTGASTTFTSAMVGRKVRIASENAYYRISAFVSTTELTLEVAYRGSLTSGNTYSLYKDEYRLPADMNIYKVLRQIEDARSISDIDNTAFDIYQPSPRSQGNPNYSILAGTKLDTYSTGTVSASVSSSTITGSSTVWASVEGLGRGTKLTIGSNVYTVESVDSDTQITIYETTSVAVSAGTAYSLSLDNYIIQFYPIPDSAENIYFKYQRVPYLLFNDQDVPDLPDQWHHVLISAGLIWGWETKDKEESKRYEALFAAQVVEMWGTIGYPSSNRSRPRVSQDFLAWKSYPGDLNLPSGYGYPVRI